MFDMDACDGSDPGGKTSWGNKYNSDERNDLELYTELATPRFIPSPPGNDAPLSFNLAFLLSAAASRFCQGYNNPLEQNQLPWLPNSAF